MMHPAIPIMALVCLLAVGLQLLDLCNCMAPGVRVVLGLAFLLVAPGLGWVRSLRLGRRWVEGMLVIATSLALDSAVGLVLAYFPRTTPGSGLGLATLIALAGLAVWRISDRRRGWMPNRPRGVRDE